MHMLVRVSQCWQSVEFLFMFTHISRVSVPAHSHLHHPSHKHSPVTSILLPHAGQTTPEQTVADKYLRTSLLSCQALSPCLPKRSPDDDCQAPTENAVRYIRDCLPSKHQWHPCLALSRKSHVLWSATSVRMSLAVASLVFRGPLWVHITPCASHMLTTLTVASP